MRKKKGIFLTFMYLMVFIPTIAANSVARERIWIKNDLENSITVYCEFQHKDGNTTQNFPSYWNQPLLGRGVTCDSFLESGEKRVYKAKKTLDYAEAGFAASEKALPSLLTQSSDKARVFEIMDKFLLEYELVLDAREDLEHAEEFLAKEMGLK